MDYIFERDGICYHTGTGKQVNPRKYLPERENLWSPLAGGDMERDTSKVVFPERVRKNQFYSYDTEVLPDGVVLL